MGKGLPVRLIVGLIAGLAIGYFIFPMVFGGGAGQTTFCAQNDSDLDVNVAWARPVLSGQDSTEAVYAVRASDEFSIELKIVITLVGARVVRVQVDVLVIPPHIAEPVAKVGIVTRAPGIQVVLSHPERTQCTHHVIQRRVIAKALFTLFDPRRAAGVDQAADIVVVMDLVRGLQRGSGESVSQPKAHKENQDNRQYPLGRSLTHRAS